MSLALFYGGTFDPVHAGHLAVAQAAHAAFGAEVAFVPAADPPHRATPGASAAQRAQMLALAIADEPGFRVDPRELRRSGPSWTVSTLRELRAERGPDAALAWVLGADAFRGLPGWHDWETLMDLAHFVVAVRPGHGLEALPPGLAAACQGRWREDPTDLARAPAGCLFRLDMALHPASATEVREGLAREPGPGHPWLDPAVAAFITREGLYRGGPGPAGV
ncbi:nicotinate-nucleotide adenylyltransferase [Arenimonas alkanexedens]